MDESSRCGSPFQEAQEPPEHLGSPYFHPSAHLLVYRRGEQISSQSRSSPSPTLKISARKFGKLAPLKLLAVAERRGLVS
jgi:hypothetical protein